MGKITLSVDERVVERAKRYAKVRGISVSEMVETYLSVVANPTPPNSEDTPVLRKVRGVLKSGNLKDYRKHLATKYQ